MKSTHIKVGYIVAIHVIFTQTANDVSGILG
jgi:hypothetical protein